MSYARTRSPLASTSTGSGTATSTAPTPQTGGANPSAPTGNTHAGVDVEAAVNAPGAPMGMCREEDTRVKILHGATNPLEVAGPAAPSEDQLFERSSFLGNLWGSLGTDAGYQSIVGIDGTTHAPTSYNHLDENALTIGGTPAAADVQQGGWADCYMLAAVASLAASQPAKIQSIVTGTAQAATVNLYRNDGTGTPTPTAVSVDNQLLVEDFGGGATGTTPIGAGFRVGQRPVRTSYWVEISGQTLTIFADRWFESGMWAPLLEKGYASFAQQYGQYGGFNTASERAQTNPDGTARDGYDIISGAGGASAFAWGVLLGNSATLVDGAQTDIAFTPGANLVTANLGVIRNLLAVTGAGMPAGTTEVATVGISRDEVVNRLEALANTLLARPDIATHGDLVIDLNVLKGGINMYRNDPTQAEKDADLAFVQSTCGDIVAPGTYPVLADPNAAADYRAFALNAGTAQNLLSDSGGDRRNVYAWHFYSVLGASFAKADGSNLAIDVGNYTTEAANIDPARSNVRLRNPHGKNEPDAAGTGPADGTNNGEFTMSLETFITSFGHMQAALIT